MTSINDDIDDFYNTRLGNRVRAALMQTAEFEKFIGDGNRDEPTLIVGYGIPYFSKNFISSENCNNIFSAALSSSGAFYWPPGGKNKCVHCDASFMPFDNDTFGRIIVIHGFEHTYHPGSAASELQRILAPDGRMMMIVPNRSGSWIRSDKTPFSHGLPYSLIQITALLKKHKFTVFNYGYAVRIIPFARFLPVKGVLFLENCAKKLHLPIGGFLMLTAGKRLYTPIGKTDKSLNWKLRSFRWSSLSS